MPTSRSILWITMLPSLVIAGCGGDPSAREAAHRAGGESLVLAETAEAGGGEADTPSTESGIAEMNREKIEKSEAEWKAELTPEQYHILREKGTERAFTGEYWDTKTEGVYTCAACDQPLYSSETKFDSGTGWPSFWDPIRDGAVSTRPDRSWFTTRTEVVCSRCEGHLGHVFDDGPEPTGKRHCLNSAALKLVEADEAE